MTPSEWQRVRELFEAALELRPEERAAWLASASASPSVVSEVESLLQHDARAGAFLDASVAERAPSLLEDDGLAPGTTIGHYRIVREIGRGAMGRVYRADDEMLGRAVAVKALAPHLTSDPTHRERLRREAQAAAALAHPGICTVFTLIESDGDLFIVSELVEGRTLRDEIGGGAIPDARAIEGAARELADALAAAHARGITHRDFKPENVMRDGTGRLRVLDFGLAFAESAGAPPAALATLPGVLIGTPAYMAPEQLNGQRADARSDVFAYGVVMYEYACGEHPFGAGTPIGLVARILESAPQPMAERRPDLPPEIAAVIDRCLEKSPAGRLGSAQAVAAALRQPGTAAPPRVRPVRLDVWWRTHQVILMMVYAGAATLSWAIKEAFREPKTLWAFVALGIAATIGGIARGHLLFTSALNAPRLASERMRIQPMLRAIDLFAAFVLTAEGLWIAPVRPLWGVLTAGLGVGVGLAALLMEPATSAAMFGE
jgi:tRNA A-37 threonylcarbamoyl transferase component Bud32